MSVSYTHLDVYKRQSLLWAILDQVSLLLWICSIVSMILKKERFWSMVKIFAKSLVRAYEATWGLSCRILIYLQGPLLVMWQDVYKRQPLPWWEMVNWISSSLSRKKRLSRIVTASPFGLKRWVKRFMSIAVSYTHLMRSTESWGSLVFLSFR